MTGAVRRKADRPRHDRGGGASTVQMTTPDTGARALLNGFTHIPPGGGIPLHHHNVEESVLILSGAALVEIDGTTTEGGAGDVVWVQAGVPHRFRNASDSAPLEIFWTYAGAHATRTLADTGETRPIVSPGDAG